MAANIPQYERLLVVQPSKELLEQNHAKYINLCGGLAQAGIYSASFGKKEIGRITYATIGSIKDIGQLFREHGFTKMLIDEAHLYPRKEQSMLGKFLKDSGITQVLGITATPLKLEQFSEKQGDRFDKWSELIMLTNPSPTGTFFKKILHVGQISEMTSMGFWSPLRYEILPFERKGLEMNTTGSEFSENSLIRAYIQNNTRANIFGCLNWHKDRRHALVFVPTVEEAMELARLYPNSAYVSGDMSKKDRKQVIDGFRSGDIRVIFNVGVLTCLSEDTELLTRDGWKTSEQISYEDDIAQWEDGIITFEKPTNIIHKEYSGEMVYADNRYMSMNITGDHNMLYTTKTTGNAFKTIDETQAHNLVGKRRIFIPINGNSIPETIHIPHSLNCSKSRFVIQNAYNYRKKGISPEDARQKAEELYLRKLEQRPKNPDELTLDDCRFIGFWLGDGYVQTSYKKGKPNGKKYSLSQSTANPGMIEWIENLLRSCKINYSTTYRQASDIVNGRKTNAKPSVTFNLYKGTGGDKQFIESNLNKLEPYLCKDGTPLYWGLNKQQYLALMEGLWKADGEHGNNRAFNGRRITSANKKTVDLLQAIGVCRGYRVIVSEVKKRAFSKKTLYRISLSDIHYHEFVNDLLKARKVENENVWCVTMPKGTIVTRHKGRVSIMGNCGFDYPKIDMLILGRSTASVALYYQILGRGVRIDPEKKDCLIVDMGGNCDRFGKVEDIFFKKGDRWRMYGTGGRLLSGVPVDTLGKISRLEINQAYTCNCLPTTISFGKHKGKHLENMPMSYLKWIVKERPPYASGRELLAILKCVENYVRDTTDEPPVMTMPDGQHAGESLLFIPTGYLKWYYGSREWNECNDSLKRGIENVLGYRNA